MSENKGPNKILLVDDETQIVSILKIQFENRGYEVVTAHSGNSGYAKFEKYSDELCLILSDIRMPDGDGVQFLKRVKETELGKKIPFLLLSGYSDVDEEEAKKWGVEMILQKPMDILKLGDIVAKLLAK